MTQAQRAKAMGRVIDACNRHKDKKPLAEAVRQIVKELQAAEKAHREQAAAEHAANLFMKTQQASPPTHQ